MAVLINGRTAVHKDSNGKVLTVDVCLTKVGKYTVPIPYMNMAQSSDSDKTAGGVFIDGNPACHKDSTFSKSRGDEPGNKKGIRSRKKGDYASFIMGSANVQFEGTPAVRALELMVSNARNTPPSPLMQAVGLPPLPKQAASEDALAPFVGPFFEPVIQEGRSGLRTRELVASLEDPHSQPEHEAFTLSEAGEIILSGLHRAATHMALVCKETTPWEHKPNDRILLPLCEARHSRIGEEAEYHDIALQALTLKRYLSPDADPEDTDKLREGWLYVFVNGYLWREQQVTEHGYRDVDLHTWHGTDGPDHQQRPATGTLNDHLTVPHHLEGTPAAVQIAFSEVQWSWERISEFGGMKEDDARLLHKVEEDETLTDIARYYPDTTVEQLAELNGLDDPDQIQAGQLLKIRDLPSPPADADDRRTKRMGEKIDFDEAEAQDFELIIADPLGVVESFNATIGILLLSQQNIQAALRGEHLLDTDADIDNPLERMPPAWIKYTDDVANESNTGELVFPGIPETRQPGENWRTHVQNMSQMAQIAYPLLFSEEEHEEADEDTLKAIEKAKKQTNLGEIERWLYSKDRTALRARMRRVRNLLVDYLQSTVTDGPDWTTALADYALLPAPHYIQLWTRFSTLVELTVVDPNAADHNLDLESTVKEEQQQDNQPGLTLMANIINGENDERWIALNQILFPEEGLVDVYSAEPVDEALYEEARSLYEYSFSFQRLRESTKEELNPLAGANVVKHIGQALENTAKLLNIASNVASQWLDGPTVKQVPIIGFMKSTDIEMVRNLHLLANGPQSDSFVLGTGSAEQAILKIEELDVGDRLTRNQRQSFARNSNTALQQGEASTRISGPNGQAIVSNNLTDLTPYDGGNRPLNSDMTAEDVFKIYGKTGNSQGIHPVSGTMLVALPRYHFQQYESLTKAVGKSSQAVMRSFPAAMLFFELQNFKAALTFQDEGLLPYLSGLMYRTAVLISSGLIATEALLGHNRVVTILRSSNRQFIQSMAVSRTIKLGNLLFRAPSYMIRLTPILSAIIASTHLISGFKALRLGQKGVAASLMIAAFAEFSSTIFFLGAFAASKLKLLFGAIGVTLFIGGLVALYIAWKLTPGPLENWARYGPFPLESKHRFNPDEFINAESALNYLVDLLFKPRVTQFEYFKLESQDNNSYIVVNLELEVPRFSVGSNLTYGMDVYGYVQESMVNDVSRTRNALYRNFQPSEQTESFNENGSKIIQQRYRLPWDESVSWLRRQLRIHTGFLWRLRVKHQMSDGITLPASESNGEWFFEREYSRIHNISTVPSSE